MEFSVLMSIYFKEDPSFLEQSLNSIVKQTILPNEIVLIKDGPLTKELDMVLYKFSKEYPNLVKIISLDSNIGLGMALNEGINHSSYDLIARMDSDDICYPDRFEKQLSIFNKYPDISFVGTGIAEFSEDITIISGYRIPPQQHQDIIQYAKEKSPLNHATVMYRKQAVLDAGCYREFPEDYHLWIRALMKGYKFYNIQEPLLYVRFNETAILRRGGLKYALIELKHQREFYKMGFLSFPQFIKNSFIRFSVRILPVSIRQYIYENKLRIRN